MLSGFTIFKKHEGDNVTKRRAFFLIYLEVCLYFDKDDEDPDKNMYERDIRMNLSRNFYFLFLDRNRIDSIDCAEQICIDYSKAKVSVSL